LNQEQIKKQAFFEKLLSLLLGAAWALVIVGSTSFFLSLYHLGIFIALLGAFIGALLGLFFVVVFEIAQIQTYTTRRSNYSLENLKVNFIHSFYRKVLLFVYLGDCSDSLFLPL